MKDTLEKEHETTTNVNRHKDSFTTVSHMHWSKTEKATESQTVKKDNAAESLTVFPYIQHIQDVTTILFHK